MKAMPQKVQQVIQGILEILSTEYGEDRLQYEDDGGLVVLIEKSEDFQELKEKTYIDVLDVIPEFVDKIVCSNGEIFVSVLVLCSNDYGISQIIPMELASRGE